MSSNLDQQQILQQSFDEEKKGLRVVAELAVNGEELDVQTSPNRISIFDFSQYIGTESTKILEVKPNRSMLLIQNNTRKKVWLDFNQPAQAGFPSVLLNPNSTLFQDKTTISIDSIYAIAEDENIPLIIKEG